MVIDEYVLCSIITCCFDTILFVKLTNKVMQLVKDFDDVDEVNKQLEKMGYNIGVRLIDEFLAKSGTNGTCQNHREMADVIAKVAFKMFLGVSADVTAWNAERNSFCLVLYENPLNEFVELPAEMSNLS